MAFIAGDYARPPAAIKARGPGGYRARAAKHSAAGRNAIVARRKRPPKAIRAKDPGKDQSEGDLA
jgi:hypothetical protein